MYAKGHVREIKSTIVGVIPLVLFEWWISTYYTTWYQAIAVGVGIGTTLVGLVMLVGCFDNWEDDEG